MSERAAEGERRTLTIGSRPPEEPASTSVRPARGQGSWHVRANVLVLAYLLAAVGAVAARDALPVPRWLAIHLLLLGAATNAIVTWGEHFAVALLRAPSPSARRSGARIVVLNAGIVSVLVGVSSGWTLLTTVGTVLLLLVVSEHAVELVRLGRRALQNRFAGTVRFYVAGALALLPGLVLGRELAVQDLPDARHEALHAAHVHANLLGWVGLTVLGTLFTLWPTVLRTRIAADAMAWARRTLVLTVAGLSVAVLAFALDVRSAAAAGLVVYAAGVGAALVPLVRTARQKARSDRKRWGEGAAWMLAASCVWLLFGVLADASLVVLSPDASAYAGRLDALVPPLLVGFVGQVLLGALTYLLPVVLGGGPFAVRAAIERLAVAWPWRLALLDGGLLLTLVPLPGAWRWTGWVLVLASALWFLALAESLLVPPLRPSVQVPDVSRREAPAAPAAAPASANGSSRTPLVVGLVLGLVMVVLPVGLATSGHRPSASSDTVSEKVSAPTVLSGVQRVEVQLVDMDIRPSSVTVAPGTRVTLVVTNKDAMRHDLVFPGGPGTQRLRTGQTQELDLGVVTKNLNGWCSVPGHKAMGMTFDVVVAQRSGATPASSSAAAPSTLDVHGQPGAGWKPWDARLAPAPSTTVHRVTLPVIETVKEVAPGVRQQVWTFGGTVPGPVLRGHVGDVFEVTLINGGTMSHGIDFHAGQVAPDVPMRVLEPGQSLVYRFTADHAGAWLYHCSAMPMSQHIANGMYGAVVIDPPGLPPVDREYVLLSGEQYLGAPGGTADPAKLRADAWDTAVFNGYPDQYLHAPLTAGVGERVRFWVVAAGPDDGTAFHVVGAQFDTVYKEGAYLLRPGPEKGAAQVLDLSVAQGGFAEATFGEAGHYALVDHDMRKAENGARGMLVVSPVGGR
jgi:nitrite reductase (NO-forming)